MFPQSKNLELLNGKIKENMLTHEARIIESGGSLVKVVDKSNDSVNHPPQFRDIASKNNYLQVTCTIGVCSIIIQCYFASLVLKHQSKLLYVIGLIKLVM